MRNAYLDASAILKLSRGERESLALVDHLSHGDLRIATSVIAEVEVLRALQRARADRQDQDEAMRGIYLLQLDGDVRRAAMRLQPQSLRALDAIHVGSAVTIGHENLEFITYDGRMAAAAREAGLKVVSPGR